MLERVMSHWGFDEVRVMVSLNAPDLYLWLAAVVAALLVSVVLVFRKWDAYELPMRLLPLDILTIILLIDLNIKSLSNVTIEDFIMKLEAIAFTGLLAFVLFAPVFWKVSHAAPGIHVLPTFSMRCAAHPGGLFPTTASGLRVPPPASNILVPTSPHT